MSNTRRFTRSLTPLTLGAGVTAGLAGLLLASPAGAAATPSGDVDVINRETVQAELAPTGKLEHARLYSQLTMTGKGRAVIADPSSSEGVRDLDGFSGPILKDGKAHYVVNVDGREERRTVADFDQDLPVQLKVSYTLDGEPIEPEDVVGKSGLLVGTYVVRNTTTVPTEITYKDGKGTDVTETVDLVAPLVGQLRTTLPSSFSSVAASGADVAGDGRGGTELNWSLVLFNPLGEPAQQLRYTAMVKDAVLPPATLQVVPVTPESNPILETGMQSIADGATGAAALTAGAYKIDGKLGELRDGVSKLLAGMVQLADGASELEAGLAGSAAPGADKIADGLGSAKEGSGKLGTGLGTLAKGADDLSAGLRAAKSGSSQLAAGAGTLGAGLGSAKEGSAALAAGLGELDAGAGTLATGLGSASAGSQTLLTGSQTLAGGADQTASGAASLASGLALISGGLDQLKGATGLPVAVAGLEQLRLGLDHPVGAAGPADPGGLLQGLSQIAAGLSHPAGATGPADPGGVKEGLAAVLNPAAGLPHALDGVTASKEDLAASLAGDLATLDGTATKNGNDAVDLAASLGVTPNPAGGCFGIVDAQTGAACTVMLQSLGVAGGVDQVVANAEDSLDGLTELEGGLGAAVTGLSAIKAGVDQLAAGSASARDGVQNLILPGVDQLIDGLTAALTGVNQLATGATTATTGAGALAAGTQLVADGADKLVLEGTTPLAAGLGQLYAGGQRLSAGTTSAAAGAVKLDGGLAQLAEGGGKAVAGVVAIDEGLAKLADGGGRLADGAKTAAAGAGALDSGLGQLLTGSLQLADGLDDAAEGSGKLAEGLSSAKDGVVQLEDGGTRLRAEGTGLLAGSANVAAVDNAKKAAMLKAISERGGNVALPYGAPEGALGTAAYDFVLAGADGTSDANAARGGAAIALLALASASGFFVRRRFAG